MESEKIGIDNLIYKAEIGTKWGGGELGDCDWHIYTIDTMYKIDN